MRKYSVRYQIKKVHQSNMIEDREKLFDTISLAIKFVRQLNGGLGMNEQLVGKPILE